MGKNLYLPIFLQECKFVVNVKKMPEYINDDEECLFDKEISNEKNSDEENSYKEN